MKKSATMYAARIRRHARVRKRITGTPERPRMSVFRSSSHIYVQVINDVDGVTIASASDLESSVKQQAEGKKKEEVATLIGGLVADRAKAKGVSSVVFDRGGYTYHGRIKALAQAARDSGLQF